MKIFSALLSAFLFFVLSGHLAAQDEFDDTYYDYQDDDEAAPGLGLFVSAGGRALFMRGSGTSYRAQDFGVTNDIYFEGQLAFGGASFPVTLVQGWGWDDRYLYALNPGAGYRFNSRFAIAVNYSFFGEKTGTKLGLISTATPETAAEMIYQQQSLQVMGRLYLTDRRYFLTAGFEMVFMEAEIDHNVTVVGPVSFVRASGSAETAGLVIGSGVELPMPGNFSLLGSLAYSFIPYDGLDLLSNSFFNTDIPLEIDVGGLTAAVELTWYFRGNEDNEPY